MIHKSFSEVLGRTLDYLARKHPWFGSILRNRLLAGFVLTGYAVIMVSMGWQVYAGEESGWKEIIKSYSPLFFDLFVIFVFSIIFLVARGYYIEENSRIDGNQIPDPNLFLTLQTSSVQFLIEDNEFFQRHSTVSAVLDALPIDQSDFFLAHAGSLDIPKLTLLSIERTDDTSILLRLGVGSFKEFFFTHHFADYVLSRSSSKDSGKKETLRDLFSPMYFRAYLPFFTGKESRLNFLSYTPNTLGVTGLVRILCGSRKIIFFQRRGHHESAARGFLHLSYAGTLNAFPNFVGKTSELSLDELANDEFEDEFMTAEPGRLINRDNHEYQRTHELVGICANSQYLFQPELFVLTTITVKDTQMIDKLLTAFNPNNGKSFWALETINQMEEQLLRTNLKLRPLCEAAIKQIYIPRLDS